MSNYTEQKRDLNEDSSKPGANYLHHSNLQNEFDQLEEEESDQISPVGVMTVAGFGFLLFMLASTLVCFISPFWYQTWPTSFNTFQSLGLWEVCFSDYIHHKDDTMHIYSGCYHIYGTDPSIVKLREWLAPPWFITCQILMTTAVLVEVASIIVLTVIFMHHCPIINHEYHEIYGLFIVSAFMFLCVLLISTTAGVFASSYDSRNWMPRPDLNFLSWGYGFCLTSGMLGLFAGACFFLEAKNAYNLILEREDIVLDNAEKEILLRSEMMEQASFMPKIPLTQMSFQTQPSFVLPTSYDFALLPVVQPEVAAGYPMIGYQLSPLGMSDYQGYEPDYSSYNQPYPAINYPMLDARPVYTSDNYYDGKAQEDQKQKNTQYLEEFEYVK